MTSWDYYIYSSNNPHNMKTQESKKSRRTNVFTYGEYMKLYRDLDARGDLFIPFNLRRITPCFTASTGTELIDRWLDLGRTFEIKTLLKRTGKNGHRGYRFYREDDFKVTYTTRNEIYGVEVMMIAKVTATKPHPKMYPLYFEQRIELCYDMGGIKPFYSYEELVEEVIAYKKGLKHFTESWTKYKELA